MEWDRVATGSAFATPSLDEWRALAAKALKGVPFDRVRTTTRDGTGHEPLYTQADLPHLPKVSRHVRGTPGTWDIRQLHAHPDPVATQRAVLDDLTGGATSLWLRLDDGNGAGDAKPEGLLAPSLSDLATALDGVHLDLAPVTIEAGAGFMRGAALLMALWQSRGHAPGSVDGGFGADPLGCAVMGRGVALDRAMADAARLAIHTASAWPGVTALLANGEPYHAAGATEAQELAAMLASAVAYLRLLDEAGLPPAAGAAQIAFRLAIDADLFAGIAKLRALRVLWARVLDVAGAGGVAPVMQVHAVTSTVMMARVDPWVNMLRTTAACFAAGIGGADSVTVLPFDHALGLPDAFSRRIARNTHHVLIEEAGLGHVADPAGGSYAIEAMTDALARKAWEMFQAIEAEGGMRATLERGSVQAAVQANWAARARLVATRREALTGVSEFPNLVEKPRQPAVPDVSAAMINARERRAAAASIGGLSVEEAVALACGGVALIETPGPADPIRALAPRRLAEPFEALRAESDALLAARGTRPRVLLCALGDMASAASRVSFARNLFEAGGFETVMTESVLAPDSAVAALKRTGAGVVALCGSDAVYGELAMPVAAALKAAGCRQVMLMGQPGDRGAAYREAGIDGHAYLGSDAVTLLRQAMGGAVR